MAKKISGPRTASFIIEGTAPLVYGRQVFAEKLEDETHQQYEERTALQKVTVDSDGFVAMNSDALKRSLEWAASWRNDKVPGGAGGKATFKKRFTAGVQSMGATFPVFNGKKQIKPEELRIQHLSVPSDGQRGGKKRVVRVFPTLDHPWSAQCKMVIWDQAIDDSVFSKHLSTSGLYDGIGSMRVGSGGPNGRFTIGDIVFESLEV